MKARKRRSSRSRRDSVARRRRVETEAVLQGIARFLWTRPKLHRSLEERPRLRLLTAMCQDCGKLEGRVEVVGVSGQFLAERCGGAIGIARKQQRLPVVRFERWHVRIERDGFGELADRARVIVPREKC